MSQVFMLVATGLWSGLLVMLWEILRPPTPEHLHGRAWVFGVLVSCATMLTALFVWQLVRAA